MIQFEDIQFHYLYYLFSYSDLYLNPINFILLYHLAPHILNSIHAINFKFYLMITCNFNYFILIITPLFVHYQRM